MAATRHNGFTVDLARASRRQPSRQELRAMSRQMDAALLAANPMRGRRRLSNGTKFVLMWTTPGLPPLR